MTFRCGQNAFLRGDWEGARNHFDRGMRSSRALGRSSISAYPPFGHALLALAAGDLEAARAYAEQSRQIAGSIDGEVVRAALAVLAECELRDGRPEEAIELIAGSSSGAQGLGLHPVQPVRSEVLRALGRRGEALVEAEEAIAHARRRHNVVALIDALRARALSAEPAQAGSDIEEGLETVARIGYPYGEVRLLQARATLWADAASLQRAQRVLDMLREGTAVAGRNGKDPAKHESYLK